MAPSVGSSLNLETNRRRTVGFHMKTIFLFTKSDIKTVLIPQSVFALSMVYSQRRLEDTLAQPFNSSQTTSRLIYMMVWIYLHLLVEDITNQRKPKSVLEDKINRPWRPIPAGRLTAAEARSILRIAVFLSLATSFVLNTWMTSVSLMTAIWLYNDLDCHNAGPWLRNGLNVAGMTCFGRGAVTVLLGGHIGGETEKTLRNWHVLMGAVIQTTVHAQDFADIAGDKARNRKTMPLLYCEALSRWTVAVPVPVWSFICLNFWHVDSWVVQGVLLGIAGNIAVLVTVKWGKQCDEWAWRLWCLWVTVLYLLPLFSSTISPETPLTGGI
ncbi:UbiA prenyltransferase family-domain-containing protein [Hypoxylon sp. FL0543]|nr:UbiA prenyltransferase family-domain-containing protein [Hypoxylon sp. FL0543]